MEAVVRDADLERDRLAELDDTLCARRSQRVAQSGLARGREDVHQANVATQTVGVFPPSRKAGLRDALAAAGAQRVVELGKAIAFEVGISHDGFHPLQRFVRWVNDEG